MAGPQAPGSLQVHQLPAVPGASAPHCASGQGHWQDAPAVRSGCRREGLALGLDAEVVWAIELCAAVFMGILSLLEAGDWENFSCVLLSQQE